MRIRDAQKVKTYGSYGCGSGTLVKSHKEVATMNHFY
jgi:hypothetical protein